MLEKLAVQLYTLRDACSQDFHQVLRDLKQMGWSGVQMAGYHHHDPEELAAYIRGLGLQTAGLHVGYARFAGELDQLVREAQWFQTRDIICPSLPLELRNEQGYREAKRVLTEAAATVRDQGIRISYHNHAFEFETTVDGSHALDYLLEPAADNPLLAELDVYWVKKGGLDVESYIAKYTNRMPIIHLKDMAKDEAASYAPIGTGSIDFAPILRWGEANGIEWYVVEQDQCDGDPMDSVTTSFRNLNGIISTIQGERP